MSPSRALRCLGFLLSLLILSASAARAETRVITVPNTSVRSAPFDVAPEIARLQGGDRIQTDDQPQGEWRRIVLPTGRSGFVKDGDTQHTDGPPPGAESAAPPPGTPPAPPPPGTSPTSPPAVVPPRESFEPPTASLFGFAFDLLPVGTLSATNDMGDKAANDTVFAVAVSMFADGALSPYFSLGVSPQVIFRVKGDGVAGQSATEYDLRGRLTGMLPLSSRVRAFGRLSPGYSVIDLPALFGGVPTANQSNPKGFIMDVSVGVEVAVLPRLFLVSGLGYQLGFQSSSDGDLRTRYLHLGAGFALAL